MKVYIALAGRIGEDYDIVGVYSSYDKLMARPYKVRHGLAVPIGLEKYDYFDALLWEVDGEQIPFDDGA